CLKSLGCSYKRETTAVFAVALHNHLIHRHQLQELSLADSFKSRTRNTKNIYKPVNKEEDAEKEYVLDPSLPQLTLGLIMDSCYWLITHALDILPLTLVSPHKLLPLLFKDDKHLFFA
ncbi:unnamed protein product, partial [Bubo scandiacus]